MKKNYEENALMGQIFERKRTAKNNSDIFYTFKISYDIATHVIPKYPRVS